MLIRWGLPGLDLRLMIATTRRLPAGRIEVRLSMSQAVEPQLILLILLSKKLSVSCSDKHVCHVNQKEGHEWKTDLDALRRIIGADRSFSCGHGFAGQISCNLASLDRFQPSEIVLRVLLREPAFFPQPQACFSKS